jgi:signal transduction histidine kinase
VIRALDVIERNATLQLQLVEDLLNASRILAGKLAIDRIPIDFAEVARAAVESVRPAAMDKNIELHASIDPAAGPMEGDAARLQQVAGNLLANAVKFTAKNGRIDLRLEPDEGYARLTVTDNGEGIPAGFLPHVFERFRQAEHSLGRKHDGLGLGLAIVKHLVEAHNGTVEAHSGGMGKGSAFVVRLPLRLL